MSYQEGDTTIKCDVIRNGSNMVSATYLRIKDVEFTPVEAPVHPLQHNLAVSPMEFMKTCGNLCLTKPVHILINCYKEGIKFTAIAGDDSVQSEYSIGNIRSGSIVSHKVYPSTIKALGRLPLMSAHGSMIKLYFHEEMPIWIKTSIGIYGSYTLLLREEL